VRCASGPHDGLFLLPFSVKEAAPIANLQVLISDRGRTEVAAPRPNPTDHAVMSCYEP